MVQEKTETKFGLVALSEASDIPIGVYQRHGLTEVNHTSYGSVIKTPYYDKNRSEIGAKFLLSTDPSDYIWRKDSNPYGCALYGAHELDTAYQKGYVYLAYNEIDCITLWHNDLPAVALPDTATWNEHTIRKYLGDDRIGKVFVLTDAETVINRMKGSAISDKFLLTKRGGTS